MRRLLILLVILSAQVAVFGQTISRIEYFFDTDPGYGSAIPATYSPGSSVTSTFDINTSGLAPGLHYLLIRAKNSAGRWSTVSNYPVFVPDPGPSVPIVRMEYFFDTDPGFGQATTVPITPGVVVPAFFQLNTAGLANGLYLLCVRAKDAQSRWSILSSSMLVVQELKADIVRLEYFVDTDPGFGNGSAITTPPGPEMTASFTLNPAGYGPGMHYVCVRALDQNKKWSTLSFHPFVDARSLVSPAITAMEYFIDADPGFGQAIQVPVTAGSKVDAVFIPATSTLSAGTHYICVRVKNAAGNWSNLQQYLFSKASPAKSPITWMEYYTDNDPGFGLGNPVGITPGQNVTARFNPDTIGMTLGNRLLVVRVKDAAGNWSIIQDTTFKYSSTPRTWTGAVSDDWNVAGNWSPVGVPGWNDDVLIPETAPFMPVVRDPGLSCREVVVSPGGGELHISPGFVLTVNGSVKLD